VRLCCAFTITAKTYEGRRGAVDGVVFIRRCCAGYWRAGADGNSGKRRTFLLTLTRILTPCADSKEQEDIQSTRIAYTYI